MSDESVQKVGRPAATPQEVRTLAEALEARADPGWGAPREWGAEELADLRRALEALHNAEAVLRRTLEARRQNAQFLDRLKVEH